VGVASEDLPGNLEAVKTLTTEIHFESLTSIPTSTPTTTPETTPTPTPNPEPPQTSGSGSPGGNSSGGAGGNGPIANSFGAIGNGPITNPVIPGQNNVNTFFGGIGGDGSELDLVLNNSNQTSGPNSTDSGAQSESGTLSYGATIAEASTDSGIDLSSTSISSTSLENLALAGLTEGFDFNWLWLLILAIILSGGYYLYKNK
jgi:hypothetical protein